MLVRLCVLPRVMALEMALMTKRGLTPVRPSSGASACRRATSLSGDALDGFARVEAQLLRLIQSFALRLDEARQDARTPRRG